MTAVEEETEVVSTESIKTLLSTSRQRTFSRELFTQAKSNCFTLKKSGSFITSSRQRCVPMDRRWQNTFSCSRVDHVCWSTFSTRSWLVITNKLHLRPDLLNSIMYKPRATSARKNRSFDSAKRTKKIVLGVLHLFSLSHFPNKQGGQLIWW